jgi:hypothetical protein
MSYFPDVLVEAPLLFLDKSRPSDEGEYSSYHDIIGSYASDPLTLMLALEEAEADELN